MINKQRIIEKAAAYGLDIAPIAPALDRYAEILVDYNKKVNLTAIVDPEGIEDKHFIDSLLFAAQPEVEGKFVDVGTGAGFPGVVAKLYKPQLELTLMEPTGKRLDFLRYLCGELGIEAEFAKERAEEAARGGGLPQSTEPLPYIGTPAGRVPAPPAHANCRGTNALSL